MELEWITVTRFDATNARSRQHDWPRHMSLPWHRVCPSVCERCFSCKQIKGRMEKEQEQELGLAQGFVSSISRRRRASVIGSQLKNTQQFSDNQCVCARVCVCWTESHLLTQICHLNSSHSFTALLGTPLLSRALALAFSSLSMFLWNVDSFFSFSGCFRPSLIVGLPVCLRVQDLTEAIPIQEVGMCRVNSAGEDICRLSTPDDGSRLQTQLKFLNTRWANVCQQLNERKRRCVSAAVGRGKPTWFLF